MPAPRAFFLHLLARDVEAMRHFYGELLGLPASYHAPDEAVGFRWRGVQLAIFAASEAPIVDGWQRQPGWSGGEGLAPSWSIELDEAGFRSAVDRLRAADVEAFGDAPAWRGYWSYPVRDPMGHTVEITYTPDPPPGVPSPTWS